MEKTPKFSVGQFVTASDGTWGSDNFKVKKVLETVTAYCYEFEGYPNMQYPEDILTLAK